MNIKFKRREDLETSLIPSIWIELHNKAQKKILLGLVYREFQTPSTTLDPSIYGRNENAQLHRLKTFENEVSMACTECERVILMGDFNINLLKRDDKEFYLPKILEEYEGMGEEHNVVFGQGPKVNKAKSTPTSPSICLMRHIEEEVSVLLALLTLGPCPKTTLCSSPIERKHH